ncbi:MAG: isoleucine--tRNA ligase, partial [Bacteroidota bacterium]|nr:isoleucine--tRNA ligase [Candidatus Kapabacteria bacterium]MDW8220766.1 isoleucine--tRNA ligase [Bacteroidota bacterium]
MFYEGPPTVNGRPGIHHVMGRTIKDMICRYKTQRGYCVPRRAGWDTHGLPVELAVEKQLGLANKQEIERIGIAKFNSECRKFVYTNIEQNQGWRELTQRMGYWLDLDNPYITCTNEYIESVWWSLKQFFDKGLIYKSFRITPQSPTLETPLSSHELSLGYKEVRDPNCYVKLPILASSLPILQGASILVWTTTPWTLVSNTALAVHPELDYVLVENVRHVEQGGNKVILRDTLVLAEALVGKLDGTYEILARFKGVELLGTQYEPPFPGMIPASRDEFPDMHTVLAGEFVSASDGSGIVHLAPAFGADDFEMTKQYKLPLFNPVSPGGRFTEQAQQFAGRTVKTLTYPDPVTGGTRTEEGADKDIVIALKRANKIYRSTNDYLHSYPHCWRTGNPIIYYARESWFIQSSAYKDQMVAHNRTINWQPPEIGAGRFGNWLEEVKDWALSRDRYWGTPLPLWIAENDPTDIIAVGSIEELKQGLYEHPDFRGGERVPLQEALNDGIELDLHRPFVDCIVFERNGKTYRRVKEVIDVWYDSGAMPFAQLHYPFENKELFERSFPAQFICEAVDQTRGWFYTLHNIASAVFDMPAFRNVIVNELILDKDAQKMSKSKGNVVDPFDVIEQYGADAVRWYFITNNPPWKPTLFNGEEIAKTVIADFFRSLTNTYSFFALYANIDGFTGKEEPIPVAERPEIDRWIISKMHSTLSKYLRYMDAYEITRAMRLVQEFVINDVSNWYVRRNRRRFWKGENDADKLAAYQTLYQVLLTIASMIAPLAPFLAEVLFQRLVCPVYTEQIPPRSVHLELMPEPVQEEIDTALETRMEKAQNIVFLARSLREKAKIKTRQPLKRILIPVSSPDERRCIQEVQDIIAEEINVKAVEYVSGDTGIVRKSAKANFKTLGKKFGKHTQHIAQAVKALSAEDIQQLERTHSLVLNLNGSSYTVELDDVEILHEDIEGWLVASHNGLTVALDTEITTELRQEGIAREFVNRIQNLRKESKFDVTDRIALRIHAPREVQSALEAMRTYVQNETLCKDLAFSPEQLDTAFDVYDQTVTVTIHKAS